MLITKTVIIRWNSKTKKYYEALGYIFTKYGDEFEVRVEDLTKGSQVKVGCSCDNCKKPLIWRYQAYNRYVKEEGKTYCSKCGAKLYGTKKANKTKLKNSKSFYDWCIENDREDLLLRWDYEKNGCSPNEVCYSSSKKYWFKCLLHPEHRSEEKWISHITSGSSNIDCNQCNSIAQYILDNFPNKKLEEVWDYEKNGDLDPWKINKSGVAKCWFICQEKDYHGSYKMKCNSFSSSNQRCPFCCSKKIHPKDSLGQYIIDNYGEDFLWKVWSNKNEKSPFEYSVGSEQKVWWNCPDNKHKSYKRKCKDSLRKECRCPKCVEERDESIYEEKVRLYLQKKYEVLTEHNCTIRPINPKTKQPLPFDNEIVLENGKHLIIEVHGEQHYKIDGYYIKSKEELEYQQYKDEYKKEQCLKIKYEYLEIPYWTFNKEEDYKKIIDNKIKEILNKEE